MLFVLLLPLALVAACDKVPLLAPTGSVINLFPATTTVSLNSEVVIIATVIENGVAAGGTGSPSGGTTQRSGNGTPVQNGTLITFTTSIGRIEPSEARTHNGQVSVRFITTGTSGTATITAYSGGASTTTSLRVGTAAANSINVSATPPNLGSNGGTALIIATVLDDGGNGVGGVPVSFTTDRGTITPTNTNTDPSGNATASLTTSGTAKVTAVAGGKNGSVTVNVTGRILSRFDATPTNATVATQVKFDVGAGSGANLTNVRVDFGDGSGTDLGAVISSGTAVHAYCSPGQFSATALATDVTGERQELRASVLIGTLPADLALVTTGGTPAGAPLTFSVTLTSTPASSSVISRYIWSFGDGSANAETTGNRVTHTYLTPGPKTIRVDVFGVGCGVVATSTLVINVT